MKPLHMLNLYEAPGTDRRAAIDRIPETARLLRGLGIMTQDDWRSVFDFTHGSQREEERTR